MYIVFGAHLHLKRKRDCISAGDKYGDVFFFSVDQIIIEKRRNSQWTSTRMQSSRMRSARMLLYGGVSLTETPLDRDPLPLWTDRHL